MEILKLRPYDSYGRTLLYNKAIEDILKILSWEKAISKARFLEGLTGEPIKFNPAETKP